MFIKKKSWIQSAAPYYAVVSGYSPQGVLMGNGVQTGRTQYTGIADSKVGTLSFWFFLPASGFTGATPFCESFGSGGSQSVHINSTPAVVVTLQNSSAANIVLYGSLNTISTGVWHQILISWDLSIPRIQMYIDDVVDTGTASTLTNATINYSSTGGQWFFNVTDGGSDVISLADVWFDPTSALDFSVTANRRKFISAGLSAVFLGSSGQLPTGSSPITFTTGPYTGWNTNLGTGGNYTTSGGSLLPSASNPP